jgi:5-formyltetrahydrofolate cyclo-ligase
MSKHEDEDDRYAFSSPACSMHELDDALLAPKETTATPELADWPAVKQWRRAMRAALLASRAALDPRARRARGERAIERLLAEVDLRSYRALGVYWPIRGEIDALDVARRHIDAGGIAAVPVVTEKNAPVEFWRWEPGMKMRRGFWNIPVPATRELVRPEALLIPLVGYDAAGFRLGYGGGYYDRTLAALAPVPLRVGLGYVESEMATIHPQSHDVPMSLIVTDERVHLSAASAAR